MLFEVIKKNKDDKNIVWRYPKRNFNTGSKLIVNESEEALFYSCGEALDLFGPGKYTLDTNNIPLLRNILNIPTGGKTPFTCDVYFIDNTVQKFKWGTPSKLEFLEPQYNFPIAIGACGELRFHIEDSRKLLVKLVGIKKNFDTESIDEFFTSQVLVKVKSYLTNVIKEKNISIFEIDGKLDEISEELKGLLQEDFSEFGIALEQFFVTNIAKPEEDRQYLKFKELYFKKGVGLAEAEVDKTLSTIEAEKEATRKVIEAEATATKRQKEGYSYQEEKSYEIGREVARNEAIGQFTNMGVGLGIMSGTSATVGDKVSKTITGAFVNGTNTVCPSCKTDNPVGAKFCKNCGTSLLDRFCSECGGKVDDDAKFCPNCGKKVAR